MTYFYTLGLSSWGLGTLASLEVFLELGMTVGVAQVIIFNDLMYQQPDRFLIIIYHKCPLMVCEDPNPTDSLQQAEGWERPTRCIKNLKIGPLLSIPTSAP